MGNIIILLFSIGTTASLFLLGPGTTLLLILGLLFVGCAIVTTITGLYVACEEEFGWVRVVFSPLILSAGVGLLRVSGEWLWGLIQNL